MPQGVYAAASAMLTEQRALETVAENVANSQSSGYRRAIHVRDDFGAYLDRARGIEDGMGVSADGAYRSFVNGNYQETGSAMDMALEGRGEFFRVKDQAGNLLLTRNGAMRMDTDGKIVTPEGHTLQGQTGEILIPLDTAEFTVDGNGRIYVKPNGGTEFTFIDQIRVAQVAEEDLERLVPMSGQYFDPAPGEVRTPDADKTVLRQGWLEASNIDPVHELVDMIAIQRRYDSAQRALSEQLNGNTRYHDILAG